MTQSIKVSKAQPTIDLEVQKKGLCAAVDEVEFIDSGETLCAVVVPPKKMWVDVAVCLVVVMLAVNDFRRNTAISGRLQPSSSS